MTQRPENPEMNPEMNLNEMNPTDEQLEELLRRERRERDLKWERRFFNERNKLDEALERVMDDNYIRRTRKENTEYARLIRLNMMNRNITDNIVYDYFERVIKEELGNFPSFNTIQSEFLKFRDGYKCFSKNRNNNLFNDVNYIIIARILRDDRLIRINNLGRNLSEVDLLVKYYQLFNYPNFFAHNIGGITNPYLMTTLL